MYFLLCRHVSTDRFLFLQRRKQFRVRWWFSAPTSFISIVPHTSGHLLSWWTHLQMPSTAKPRSRRSSYPPPGKPFPDLNATRVHPPLSGLHCSWQVSKEGEPWNHSNHGPSILKNIRKFKTSIWWPQQSLCQRSTSNWKWPSKFQFTLKCLGFNPKV